MTHTDVLLETSASNDTHGCVVKKKLLKKLLTSVSMCDTMDMVPSRSRSDDTHGCVVSKVERQTLLKFSQCANDTKVFVKVFTKSKSKGHRASNDTHGCVVKKKTLDKDTDV